MKLKERQELFLEKELWILTFGGAFGRASVYRQGTSEGERRMFREGMMAKIRNLVTEKYKKGGVDSEGHIKTIKEISSWASRRYGEILADGRLRLGIAQKLLNLHLKYLWCWGIIPEPPHCPFDRNIINKLGYVDEVSWTEMDDVRIYRKLVKAARRAAGDRLSLARWELEEFKRKGPRGILQPD